MNVLTEAQLGAAGRQGKPMVKISSLRCKRAARS
jgi:hypothetical protein